MREIAQLLNDMRSAGVITNYALFGAIAQMRYTAPVATLDADFLIAVPTPDRLDLLAPVFSFCRHRGLVPEGETIRVGAWPVQFVPAFSPLTTAAMEEADIADFEGVSLRVVRADYLAVIALSTGRAKDTRVYWPSWNRATSQRRQSRSSQNGSDSRPPGYDSRRDSSMDDHRELLRVQEEWQRAQASLSWAEKIKFAEAARDSIAQLRAGKPRTDVPPDGR